MTPHDHGINASTRRSPAIVGLEWELSAANERLLLAGKRRSSKGLPVPRVDFRVLRDLERVIHLNSQIADGAFELRMAKQ